MFKKLVTGALSAVMLFSAAVTAGLPGALTASAASGDYVDIYSFENVDEYVADSLLNGNINIYLGERTDGNLYGNLMNYTWSWKLISDEIRNNEGLVEASLVYTYLANDLKSSPYKVVRDLVDYQIYEVVLMDYLLAESESPLYSKAKLSKEEKFINKVRKLCDAKAAELLKEGKKLTSADLSQISKDEFLKITGLTKDTEDYLYISKQFDEFTKITGEIEDQLVLASKLLALCDVNQDRINFLQDLKAQAQAKGNTGLCTAIDNVCAYCRNSVFSFSKATLDEAGKFFVDKMWSEMVKDSGLGAILTSGDMSASLMNIIFNVDSISSDNTRIAILGMIDDYARAAVKDKATKAKNNKAYAKSFNADITSFLAFEKYADKQTKNLIDDTHAKGWVNAVKNFFSQKNKELYERMAKVINDEIEVCDGFIRDINIIKQEYTDWSQGKIKDGMWIRLYQDKLESFKSSDLFVADNEWGAGTLGSRFNLFDIDCNGVPELFINTAKSFDSPSCVISYDKGVLKTARINFDGGNGPMVYVNTENQLVLSYGYSSYPTTYSYFKYNEGNLELEKRVYDTRQNNGKYQVKNSEKGELIDLTKSEYDSLTSYYNSMEWTPISSGYTFDQIDEVINALKKQYIKQHDLNGDGELNTKDAMLIIAYSKKIITPKDELQFKAADINGDGRLDTKDAMLMINAVKNKKDL